MLMNIREKLKMCMKKNKNRMFCCFHITRAVRKSVSLLIAVLMIALSLPAAAFADESATDKQKKTFAEQDKSVLTETGVRDWLKNSADFINPWFVGQCDYIDENYLQSDKLIDENGKLIPYPTVNDTIHTYNQLLEATEEYVVPETAEKLLESIAATDIDDKLCVGITGGVGGPSLDMQIKIAASGDDAYIFEVTTTVAEDGDDDEPQANTYPVTFKDGKLRFSGSSQEALYFFFDLGQSKSVHIEIAPESYPESIFSLLEGKYNFTNGNGRWYTEINLNEDGSFTGTYTDIDFVYETDTSDQGNYYSEAKKNNCDIVEYYCSFSGSFKNIEKAGDYEYTAEMADLQTENEPGGTEVISADDYRSYRVYSTPYGIENAKTVHFYLPGVQTDSLPEEFMNWDLSDGSKTLYCAGIYNPDDKSGFFRAEQGYSGLEPVTFDFNKDYDEGIASVMWGPDLFSKSAFEYNQKLAAVAAGLTAAASDGGGSENEGTGRYIVPAYEALGFDKSCISLYSYAKSEENESSVQDITTDDNTFAFSIAMKKMEDFDLVTIILRGTESFDEAVGDVSPGLNDKFYEYNSYHFFIRYKDDVIKALDDFLDKHSSDFSTGRVKFLISGHSLGGAAANLVAAELDNVPRMGAPSDDVYAFTFGALNSITEEDSRHGKYGNIWNYFNFFDTFGPYGLGGALADPAGGRFTIYNKFGNVVPFYKEYEDVFTKGNTLYADHIMAGYYDAVASGIAAPDEEKYMYYRSKLSCPVDVEVYNEVGNLVCRITDNMVDEDNTYIPAFVSGDNNDEKNILIPNDGTAYTIHIIGTGDGTMDFFSEPFTTNPETNDVSADYEQIKIEKGKMINCTIPEDTEQNTEVSAADGSNTNSILTLNVVDATGKTIAHINTDGTEKKIFDPISILFYVIIAVIGISVVSGLIVLIVFIMRKKKQHR
jgi:hypothetical protein